jgi:nicotinamide riboside transporter PnuC
VIQFTITIEHPIEQTLAVLVPLTNAVAVWLAGDHKIAAWPIAITAQFVAGAYGVVSEHYGWLLSPIIVAPVFLRNWFKWKHEDDEHFLCTRCGTSLTAAETQEVT